MSSKLPPVPPANRSGKGPGEPREGRADEDPFVPDPSKDPDKKGQSGNTEVNATHKGYQQDR